jgi:hypothetical protein
MAKRSPEQLWRQLTDEAGDAPVDRAASVTVAQGATGDPSRSRGASGGARRPRCHAPFG